MAHDDPVAGCDHATAQMSGAPVPCRCECNCGCSPTRATLAGDSCAVVVPAGSGIRGVGVDVVSIPRFARALERAPRFRGRVFSPDESKLPARSLAARFAAREAALKAMGGFRDDGPRFTLRDLEVVRDADGAPAFRSGAALAAVLAHRGIRTLHLSLSHDGDVAMAMVVAEGADPAPPPQTVAVRDAVTSSEAHGDGVEGGAGDDVGGGVAGWAESR